MNKTFEELPSVFNVAAYFLEGNLAQGNGLKTAFYYKDETFTYNQVATNVRRTAALLTDLGLERENRVAILLPDTPEFVFAFWGAIWMGAIPVPINTVCTVDDIRHILQDCRAKILLTTLEWQEKLAPIQSKFLRQVVLADASPSFRDCISEITAEPASAETSLDEAAFWLYTSGSTGRPKGVIHRHKSMVVCAQQYAVGILGLHKDDITYSIAKMAFGYGLGNTLYMPMSVGATSVLSDANNAFDIIADIHRYRPTLLFGIPSTYANILAVQNISPLDISSVRLCVSAGEQLPKSIWHKWLDAYGKEICEGIGTTEILHIFLSNRLGECLPGRSGRPVPGYDIRIVDDNGLPVPPGELGNLQVAGESLMLGYWNRYQETRQVIYGQNYRTGDKYICDKDGYFWFMGRKDDLFKVNGQWVLPLEIEDVLIQHESILDAAVVPSNDGENLTQIFAYVTLKPGFIESQQLEDSIRKFVKSRLPHFKAPNTIKFLEKLPRTSTGKIHRKALKNSQSNPVGQQLKECVVST